MEFVKDSTDKSVEFRAMTTAGGALTGKVAADMTAWYRRDAGKVAIALSDLANLSAAHTDGGVYEISDGWYRLDLPDAALATGADRVSFGGTVDGGVMLTFPISLVQASSVGYSDGAVWLNTLISNTSTVDYVDGTADNPVSTLAAALTIAASIGLKRIRVANGSTVTLAAGLTAYTLIGRNWTLALGGQALSNCYFEGCTVSGVSTGTGSEWVDCHFSGTQTIGSGNFFDCGFGVTTFTTIASGAYTFVDCFDDDPDTTTSPIFVATANSVFGMRNWRGAAQFSALASTNKVTIDGAGRVVLTDTSVGGTLTIRGSFPPITGGAGLHTAAEFVAHGGVITQTQRFGTDQTLQAQLIDGAHGGSAATLTLKSVVVNNSAGVGLTVAGTTAAIELSPSASSGVCVLFTMPTDGYGMEFAGTDSTGEMVYAHSISKGLELSTVSGALVITNSNGDVISLTATGGNGDAVQLTPHGTGKALNAAGMVAISNLSGIAVDIDGASATGAVTINNSGGTALRVESTGNGGLGAEFIGFGAGAGIYSQGGATGNGISLSGIGAGAYGLLVSGGAAAAALSAVSDGSAAIELESTGETSGYGIKITRVAETGSAISLDGNITDGDFVGNIIGNITGSITGNITGNLSGSVGSVILVGTDGITAASLATSAVNEIAAAITLSNTVVIGAGAIALDNVDTLGNLTIHRGDTFSAALTDLGNLASRSKLYFTVKTKYDDLDSAAVIMIELTDGLTILNGVAVTGTGTGTGLVTSTDGSLAITDVATGDIIITLSPDLTRELIANETWIYDIQLIETDNSVHTLGYGKVTVNKDITRTIS